MEVEEEQTSEETVTVASLDLEVSVVEKDLGSVGKGELKGGDE